MFIRDMTAGYLKCHISFTFDWNYIKSYDNTDYIMLIKHSYSPLQVFDQ